LLPGLRSPCGPASSGDGNEAENSIMAQFRVDGGLLRRNKLLDELARGLSAIEVLGCPTWNDRVCGIGAIPVGLRNQRPPTGTIGETTIEWRLRRRPRQSRNAGWQRQQKLWPVTNSSGASASTRARQAPSLCAQLPPPRQRRRGGRGGGGGGWGKREVGGKAHDGFSRLILALRLRL